MAPTNDSSRPCRRTWFASPPKAMLAAALLLACGCAQSLPPVFDAAALRAARRVVVLPLADAPGPDARGSGKVVAGAVTAELVRMGHLEVVDVRPAALDEELSKAGYSAADVYDPVVCGEIARALGADAAISGELVHYGTQREHGESTTLIVINTGQTKSTHWVSLNLRLVSAGNGSLAYAGSGMGSSTEGYNPAAQVACEQAFASLKLFLDRAKKAK